MLRLMLKNQFSVIVQAKKELAYCKNIADSLTKQVNDH